MNTRRGGRHRERHGATPAVGPGVEGRPEGKSDAGSRSSFGTAVAHGLASFGHRYEFSTGTIGFLVGIGIMTWGSLPRPFGGQGVDGFLRAPEAMVWVFLIAAAVAFWFSALPFQWRWRCEVKDEFRLRTDGEIRSKHLLAVFMFLVPAALMARSLPVTRLAHHREKVMVANLLAVFAAVVALQGIWYVKAALGHIRAASLTAPEGAPETKERVRVYLFLKENLRRFITFLGAMISIGTLAKGAYRHAFIATGGAPEAFPPEYILLHGAYFTGLLALVYVPTYTRLVAAGTSILDSVFPVTAPDLDLRKLAEWQSNRKGLEELLLLRTSALDNLRASVTILAPLASGALSVLLGDKLMIHTK